MLCLRGNPTPHSLLNCSLNAIFYVHFIHFICVRLSQFHVHVHVVMDERLLECFLQALKTQLKKTDIPLLTSTFYRSYMLEQWLVA